PYQVVRHPMLVGAFAVLLGEALLVESASILLYLGVVVGVARWYVVADGGPGRRHPPPDGPGIRVRHKCLPARSRPERDAGQGCGHPDGAASAGRVSGRG